jgi:hypothetical protein
VCSSPTPSRQINRLENFRGEPLESLPVREVDNVLVDLHTVLDVRSRRKADPSLPTQFVKRAIVNDYPRRQREGKESAQRVFLVPLEIADSRARAHDILGKTAAWRWSVNTMPTFTTRDADRLKKIRTSELTVWASPGPWPFPSLQRRWGPVSNGQKLPIKDKIQECKNNVGCTLALYPCTLARMQLT